MERFFEDAGTSDADAEVDLRAVLASAINHGWEFVAAD
jgi:hypothetical protein